MVGRQERPEASGEAESPMPGMPPMVVEVQMLLKCLVDAGHPQLPVVEGVPRTKIRRNPPVPN